MIDELIKDLDCSFNADEIKISCGRTEQFTSNNVKGSWVKVMHIESGKFTSEEGFAPQKDLLRKAIVDLNNQLCSIDVCACNKG